MRQITVSLGMPIFNGDAYLEDTLRSILSQTYDDFELVISDNASTDRTEEILRDYMNQEPRIRYNRQQVNLGAAWNYNQAYRLSKGRYFKWAAADDILLPRFLEKTVSILEQKKDFILAYPKTQIIDNKGNKIVDHEDNLHLDVDKPSARLRQFLNLVGECNAVFGLIRRESMNNTHLIGNFIGSDISLLAELSLRGKFYEVPERLFLRREHEKASSWDKSIAKQLDFFDPNLRGKIVCPRTRRLIENFKSISKAPIDSMEKAICCSVVLRSFVTARDHYYSEWNLALKKLIASFYYKPNEKA